MAIVHGQNRGSTDTAIAAAMLPGATPVTSPVALTVAAALFEELQLTWLVMFYVLCKFPWLFIESKCRRQSSAKTASPRSIRHCRVKVFIAVTPCSLAVMVVHPKPVSRGQAVLHYRSSPQLCWSPHVQVRRPAYRTGPEPLRPITVSSSRCELLVQIQRDRRIRRHNLQRRSIASGEPATGPAPALSLQARRW